MNIDETYIFYNEKDDEKYFKIFKSDTEARHWYINHLDLSKNWMTLKGSIMNKILNK